MVCERVPWRIDTHVRGVHCMPKSQRGSAHLIKGLVSLHVPQCLIVTLVSHAVKVILQLAHRGVTLTDGGPLLAVAGRPQLSHQSVHVLKQVAGGYTRPEGVWCGCG